MVVLQVRQKGEGGSHDNNANEPEEQLVQDTKKIQISLRFTVKLGVKRREILGKHTIL